VCIIAATMSGKRSQFLLYTADSPNGVKVSLYLEELKDSYGLDYEFQFVDMLKGEQKQESFLKLNPNGRIPVLVDYASKAAEGKELVLWESGAILLYLAQHYDTEHKYSFADPALQAEAIQWVFFVHGGIGPMQGQAHHFVRYAVDDIPYAKKRYLDETKRLYGVLDKRLQGRDYLAGSGRGIYSFADMNCFPWIRVWPWAGVDTIDPFPNLRAWMERIEARPATKRGLDVPVHSDMLEKWKDPDWAKEKIELNRQWQGLRKPV